MAERVVPSLPPLGVMGVTAVGNVFVVALDNFFGLTGEARKKAEVLIPDRPPPPIPHSGIITIRTLRLKFICAIYVKNGKKGHL